MNMKAYRCRKERKTLAGTRIKFVPLPDEICPWSHLSFLGAVWDHHCAGNIFRSIQQFSSLTDGCPYNRYDLWGQEEMIPSELWCLSPLDVQSIDHSSHLSFTYFFFLFRCSLSRKVNQEHVSQIAFLHFFRRIVPLSDLCIKEWIVGLPPCVDRSLFTLQ